MKKVLPQSRNFLGIPREFSTYENSKIVILSAPYEHSVSYGKGTALGPKAIIDASHFVEFWDEVSKRELCFEKGIATLPPLSFGEEKNKKAIERIYRAVKDALSDEKFVVIVGGEHSISSATIRAHFEKYPEMSVLHFDAHSDLRESYEGNPYSHASVMARVLEFLPPERIVQAGIRAQCIEEYRLINSSGIKTFFASDIHEEKYGKQWQKAVFDALRNDVFITFDVDFFDPAIMPATGTPEPGGFQWDETIQLINMIGAKKNIVGFDVVELAPMKSLPFPSFLTAKLVYKILNASFSNK